MRELVLQQTHSDKMQKNTMRQQSSSHLRQGVSQVGAQLAKSLPSSPYLKIGLIFFSHRGKLSVLIKVPDTRWSFSAHEPPAWLHLLSYFRACCWKMHPVSNSAAAKRRSLRPPWAFATQQRFWNVSRCRSEGLCCNCERAKGASEAVWEFIEQWEGVRRTEMS